MLMRRELWARDEGLTALLGALLLMIFIVSPLAAAGFFGGAERNPGENRPHERAHENRPERAPGLAVSRHGMAVDDG